MKKSLIIVLSLIVLAGLVFSAVMLFTKGDSSAPSQSRNDSNNSSSGSSSSSNSSMTLTQVQANNGLNGNPCWVVAEGTIYLVPEGTKDWANGEHMKSGGKVKCGMDTGNIITSSPHGSSVLRDLKKIGTLTK